MPSSSSSVETDSPPEARRAMEPLKLSLSAPNTKHRESQDARGRANSLGCSKESGDNEEDITERRKMDTLNVSPQLHHYGIPLGTPAAREAARSFWTMDQLRVSLDKIAQYTSEQVESPSLSSLGSSIDSESLALTNSGISTPSCSQPSLSLTPSQPQATMSAPTTPLSSPRTLACSETPSPLLLATRIQGDKVATLPSSLPSSPRLSGHSQRGKAHPDLSPGFSKRMTGSRSRISSAPFKRHELKPALSVEGKQMTLASRNSSSPTFTVTAPPPDTPLRSASYGGTISPDDGFHE